MTSVIRPSNGAATGFTLIEMMVVVLIIGLLAAIGYPQYNRYVLRSERKAVTTLLQELSAKQDAFRLEHRRYAADFLELRMANSVRSRLFIDRGGRVGTAQGSETLYRIDLLGEDDGTAKAFCGEVLPSPPDNDPIAFRAVALGRQLDDEACRAMTLCFDGTPGLRAATDAGGSSANEVRDTCWDQARG